MGFVVACESCGKQLTIPPGLYEKRVRGRVVTIACKACSAPIRIDASVPPPPVEQRAEFAQEDGAGPAIPAPPRLPSADYGVLSQARDSLSSSLPPAQIPTEVDAGWEDDGGGYQAVAVAPAVIKRSVPPPLPPLTKPPSSPPPAGDAPSSSARRLAEPRESQRAAGLTGLSGLAMPSVRPAPSAKTSRPPDSDNPISLRPPIARVGRYALFDNFASGGMATVHLGRLDGAGGFSRVVAIKRLLPHLVQNAEFTDMLLKEARLAARVRHPNVVPTLDVVASRGEVLLVMEYVHGEALGSLCRAQAKRKEQIPIEIALSVIVGTLRGLHAVHESTDERGRSLGLVHRDVSPPNILVGVDGMARVLDFGIVKALEQIEETIPNRLKGKTGYMAPEQIRGERVTRTTDMFAAGIVLWELLTLRRFVASSSTDKERLDVILAGNYTPPSVHRPELPAGLDTAVMRALSYKVEDRYATAAEFADALEAASGVASGGAVAEWVRGLSEETLAARAHLLSQVENWTDGAPDIELSSSPFAVERDALTQTGETPPYRTAPPELRSSPPPRMDAVATQRLAPLDPARLSSLATKLTVLVALLGILLVLVYWLKG